MPWREWLRSLAGPDPEVERLRDELARAEERRLAERSRRRTAQDSAAALRNEVRRAYERTPGSKCEKARYLHLADAERHAAQMVARYDEAFGVYECPQCPLFPSVFRRSLHVGHWEGKGAMRVGPDGLVHRDCGCMWDVTGDRLHSCARHDRQRAKEPKV